MSDKHTPGPWHVVEEKANPFPRLKIFNAAGTHQVAIVSPLQSAQAEGVGQAARQRANADMIAAAPDLLDALENLIIGIGMGWDLDGMVDAALAAIAKAEGR